MEKVRIDGQMRECILVRSITIKCTEKGNSHGLMEDNTKVNTSKTRNRVKVSIHGQMVVSTMESG